MSTTTQQIVAGIAAAYPQRQLGRENIAAYVLALRDIPPAELQRAAAALTATSTFPPTISELRAAVFEARLQLPSEQEAWAHAEALTFEPPHYEACPACEGTGYGGELCLGCNGSGERETRRKALYDALTAPERAAYEHIGGRSAIANSDRLEVTRAQFLKAYRALRETTVQQANLDSAGLKELAPAVRAIEAGR